MGEVAKNPEDGATRLATSLVTKMGSKSEG